MASKLREDILQAILEYELGRVSDYDINTSQIKEYSKAVEGVCLKWIEKAFEAGRDYEYWSNFGHFSKPKPDKDQWLIENNLIEKQ